MTASPARFLTGAGSTTVTITGKLTNAAGAGLANQTVQFSTNAGSLNTTLPMTSANGEATVTLTTSSSATVLASAAGLNASVNVEGVAPYTIRVEPKYSIVGYGEDDEVFVSVTPAAGFPIPAPSKVVIDCGNGSDPQSIGDRPSWPCKYTSTGVFQVTVTATGDGGITAVGRATITMELRPITLALVAREKGRGDDNVEYEFTVTGAPDRSVCKWDLATTKPSTTACQVSISYNSDEADGNGNVKVSVVVDTRQGYDIQTLEITVRVN